MVEWDESLATGVPDVDQHHRAMIDGLNRFFSAMTDGEGRAGALDMLHQFDAQMRKHFNEEEATMRQRAYPGAGRHHGLHEGFLRDFEQRKRDVEADRPGATAALFEFASQWVLEHIRKEDRQFVTFLRQGGSRAAAA